MGGSGATGSQRNAAVGGLASMGTLGTGTMQELQKRAQALGSQVTPFYGSRMMNGLPFYGSLTDYAGGDVARAFTPARGAILRQTNRYANQPSGYRDALLNNLNAQQATAFDSQMRQAMMANEMAKQQGAAGIAGQEQIAGGQALGYGQLAAGANQAVLNAPQKPSGWGIAGGIAQAGLGAALAF